MKLKTAQAVRAKWDEIEAHDPDISTEKLFALTGDAFGFDNGQVAKALHMTRGQEIADVSESNIIPDHVLTVFKILRQLKRHELDWVITNLIAISAICQVSRREFEKMAINAISELAEKLIENDDFRKIATTYRPHYPVKK